jgi:hypothetical protein
MFAKLKKMWHDTVAIAELAKVAIGLGVAAIATGIVAYVLGSIETLLDNSNVATVLDYGIQAMTTLAQWLAIIALAIAIFYVLSYFRRIGEGGV